MKGKFFAVVLLVALCLVGCSTFQPVQGNNIVATDNIEVLGRVTLECPANDAGFTLLLEEAKKQYPDADDIVNIIVDSKKTFSKVNYVMSAIVIKYTN